MRLGSSELTEQVAIGVDDADVGAREEEEEEEEEEEDLAGAVSGADWDLAQLAEVPPLAT